MVAQPHFRNMQSLRHDVQPYNKLTVPAIKRPSMGTKDTEPFFMTSQSRIEYGLRADNSSPPVTVPSYRKQRHTNTILRVQTTVKKKNKKKTGIMIPDA